MAKAVMLITICILAVLFSVSQCKPVTINSSEKQLEEEPVTTKEPTLETETEIFPNFMPARSLGSNFKVNCGGDQVGDFEADYYLWTDGETGSFTNSAAVIQNSPLGIEKMYASHRYGLGGTSMAYKFPMTTSGMYTCTLHFAETFPKFSAIGLRVFDIFATGAGEPQTMKNIDIFTEGGVVPDVAITKVFTDIAVTDMLTFELVATAGDPFVSGIECARTGLLTV